MRRLITLLALSAAVLLLSLTLSALQEAPAAPSQASPTQNPAAYRMLYTRPQQDFQHMRVTLASGESYGITTSMAYDNQGNLLGVYNSLGQPVTVDGREDFSLAAVSYQMMLLTAANLPVTASYPGLDPAACGLESPAARIEITYAASAPITLTLGNLTSSGTSCYVAMEGDSSVHLVPADFHQVMTLPLSGHHRLPGASASQASDAVQVAVVTPGSATFMASKDGNKNAILPWQVTQPFSHSGSTERIEGFVEVLCALEADGYETTVYDLEGLAAYGLDNPTRLLAAFGNGEIRDIHLGHDAGGGMVYARMDSTGDIYRISRMRLEGLTSTDELLDRFVALVPVASMQSLSISAGENIWSLHSQGDSRYANDQAISTEAFGACCTAVIGLQFDKSAAAAPSGEPLAHIVFHLLAGGETTVTLYPHNQHYVQAITSGGGNFLVRAERLEAMLNTLKENLP